MFLALLMLFPAPQPTESTLPPGDYVVTWRDTTFDCVFKKDGTYRAVSRQTREEWHGKWWVVVDGMVAKTIYLYWDDQRGFDYWQTIDKDGKGEAGGSFMNDLGGVVRLETTACTIRRK